MRTPTPKKPPFKKHPLTIAVQACCYAILGASPLAVAAPTGGEVVGGSGTINQSGLNTTINQATQNLAINWQTFNVNSNERVQFIQPNASAIALNRILSNNGSTIAGRIDANGKVILVNPNGIFFTSSASLNVGSIIASGLDISPSAFMNGQHIFNEIPGTSGAVVNSGLINASLGGNVALIGRHVENNGLIVANLGTVTLAAGKQAVLTFDNGGLLGVRVTQEILQSELGVDPAVINSGEIQAQGGRVLLTASQSQDVFSRAVNTAGLEPATSVVMNDDGTFTLGAGADVLNNGTINTSTTSPDQGVGRIVLIGENVTSSGTLKADAANGNGGEIELHARDMTLLTQNSVTTARSETNGNGGIVKVLGDKVGVFDQSLIDVSGANGGGQALIGGDYRGQNNLIRNASGTYVGASTQINADAYVNGNGGRVIIWGTDSAKVYGSINARGGDISGNGGFVETSGMVVELNPNVNVSANIGDVGTWLIDPYSIEIRDVSPNSGIATSTGTNSTTFTATLDTSVLTIDSLFSALDNGTTVSVNTDVGGVAESAGGGNITLVDDFNIASINGRATLILNAHHDIIINGVIIDPSGNDDQINLQLNANSNRAATTNGGGSVFINASIDTEGGYFSATGDNITLGTGGRIVTQGGSVTLNINTQNVSTVGTINLGSTSGTDIQSNNGTVRLNGNVVLTANVDIDAGTGDILFSHPTDTAVAYTVNSQNATRRNLTLTGQDITFSGAVGATQRLGNLLITSSGNVSSGLNAILASSLNVVQSTSFTSGAITTSSTTGNGGNITIASSGAVNVGSLNSSSTLAGGNGGTIQIGGTDITLNGDIDARGGTGGTSQTADLTSDGTVSILHTGSFSSNILLTGSGGADTLVGANRLNDWQITSADGGNLNTNFTFLGIENLTGNVGNDNFTIGGTGEVSGTLNGGTGAGTNTLTGRNANNTWTITGGNAGSLGVTVAASSYVNNFTNIQTLMGGNQVDIFQLHNSANYSGSINGGAGTDELRGGNRVTTWTVTGANNTGTVTGLTAGNTFTNVETLTGNSAQDIFQLHDSVDFIGTVNGGGGGNNELRGGNRINTWSIAAANSATVTGLSTAFTNIQNITGGSNTDTFAYSVGGSISGAVNGAGGTDTVNQSALPVVSITLGATGFSNIENYIGNNTDSTLIGDNIANTWNVTASNTGTVNTTIGFSGFNNLTGGSAADNFTLPNAGDITGIIAGGVGTDSLSIPTGNNTWTITAANTGNVTNGVGTTSFNSLENLNGGTGNDTFGFDILPTVAAVAINGGGGAGVDTVNLNILNATIVVQLGATGFDAIETINITGTGSTGSLLGGNTANTWSVNAANGGTVNDGSTTTAFGGFSNLTGGSNTDDFTVLGTGSISGTIDGGAGTNSLAGRDTSSTWTVTGVNAGNVADAASYVNNFTNVQSLIAGTGNDTFVFQPGSSINSVNGGAGTDTVNMAALAVVNITLGATGYSNIEQYTGNGTNSTLTGSNTINNWNINAANEGTFNDSTSTIAFSGFNNLTGGTAADTFTLAATGSISGLIDGAGGADTLSIFVPSITVDLGNRVTANLNVDRVETISALANSNNTVTGDNVVNSWNITATNQVTVGPVTLLGFGNLVGGTNNDTFIYQVGGSLTGQINGNLGTDTVNLSALAVVNVTLGASGFSSIENLIGNNTASTLTGSVTTNTWSINAANGGTVSDGTTTTAFSGFNNLTGGANTDNFTLSGAGSLTGLIDGAGGTDSLNITIAGNQTVELGNRSTSALNVYRVETITGNSGAGITNTLVADNNTNSWTLNGTNSGSVNDGVNATTFSNFANVTGGSATDNFNLASGTISGLIDGAGGADSLTITASGNQTVELGTSINANLNVYQVETITANNSATNTLIGSNTANTWTINGSNGGNVTDGNVAPTTTTFLNFQNVVGGSAIDLFTVSNSGSIASISGGVGNDEFSIGGAVTTLNGNAGVDTVTVNTNGSVTTVNLGEGNDQFVINAGSVGTVNGDAGNDTFTVVGGNVTTIDGGFEADSSPGTDYVTYTQAGVQVTVGDNIGIGGVTVRNVEGINANNGILNARNGVTTTWTIDGLNAGRVEDTGGEGLSFTGFSILNGGADADNFIVTRSTDNTTNGRITGTINGNGGTNTLTILLTGAEIGFVSYVGTGNDTVTIGGTTGTYNGAYTPGVNLSSYDQLVYTSTAGMEFTTNYVGVDTVETNHNLVNLTVNGSANPETIELGNGTFTVGAHTPVDFGSTVTNLTLNGQGGSDTINFNNAIFGGTALTLTAEFVTGDTLSANTLVLDNVGQFGADGTPITTTINTLQLVNSGAVYINETDGLTLNTTGSVTNSGIFTIANATTINTNGGSLILNNASNDFDTVFTTGTNGSINLTDVDGIAGGDMRASSITLNTAGNVTLQTHTADLTINNSSAGDINVSNDQAVQIDLTTTGNINFTNTAGTVVVERLYTNGSGYYAAAGSVVNLTTSGAVFAYTGAGSHSPFDAPDIVGETVIVNIQGDLGVIYPGRNMSISVSNRFGFYSPGRGYVHYFAGEPPIVDNPEDLIVFSGLAGITSQQLLEVESLDEFDPAIFTEVRNYYYEDVAIMMPADQRLDGSDEDEKEQEKEGKL